MPTLNQCLIRRKWPGFGECRITIASTSDFAPAREMGTGLARRLSRLGLASLRFTVDPKLLAGEDHPASPIVAQFLQVHREALAEEWKRKTSEPDRRTADRRAPAPPPLRPAGVVQDSKQRRILVIFAFAMSLVIIGVAIMIVYQRVTNPRNARLALDTGQRQLALNEYSQAVLSFDQAVALKPDLVESYLLRGKALVASGERERGILDFTKLIELQPDDIRPLLERSQAYLNQMNFQASLADASKAIEIDPKLAKAYNVRGTAYREMGDLQHALADFNRAVELAGDQDNYYQRAATYQMLGEHLQAITDLNRLLELDPGDVPAYYARARSRRAIGDADGAKADYTYAWALEHR